jgi:hypothetical protein
LPIIGGAVTIAPLEVFHKDHHNINGKWKIANDLLRYTISELTPGSPLLEVYNGAAWTAIGNYQMRVTNAGPILPVQNVQFLTISPEETIWVERRFDTAGTALVVVTNRIRRGSRLIESQIVAASGAGLTDTQSVAIIATAGTWSGNLSADGTGLVFGDITPTTRLPGFCYLTKNANAYSIVGQILGSGLTVPAGTISRIGVLVAYQDAQWTSLGSSAAYAGRWAQYNRQRIRQRIVVGLNA